MGAGVLPLTLLKGNIFFLLGCEQNSNYWCDFGGSSNKYESVFSTAIREGYEELDGLLGNKIQLEQLVSSNLVTSCYTKRYCSYLFYVKPEILYSIPFYFNNHRTFLENEISFDVNKKDGLFEKKEVKLFSKRDLLINYQDIRPFYRNIVQQLLDVDKNLIEKYI